MGLRGQPWRVPRRTGIGEVVPAGTRKEVVAFWYRFAITANKSAGIPYRWRIAMRREWSVDGKALEKSRYAKNISFLWRLASSRAFWTSRMWLRVDLFARKPS
jgi:hypothetical protein